MMLKQIVRGAIVTCYGTIILVGAAQVFCRFVLKVSLSWSEELIRYTWIWSVLLTAALILDESGHMRVDYLVDHLPDGLRRAFAHLNDSLIMVFAIVLATMGTDLAWLAGNAGSRSPAMQLGMGWVYLAFPIGGGLMVWFHACAVFRRWRNRQKDVS